MFRTVGLIPPCCSRYFSYLISFNALMSISNSSNLHTVRSAIILILWFLIRDSRYGLRAIIIGEASNPGPPSPRDNSRTPPRENRNNDDCASIVPMECDIAQPGSLFQDASACLGVLVNALFLPPSWFDKLAVTKGIYRNDDHSEFERAMASRAGGIWVHGSSSPVLKQALRYRNTRGKIYVTDIIRSCTGFYGSADFALAAPLAGLSSRVFCCALTCLHIISRVDGWQDHQQKSAASYLYVCECECESVRAIHDFDIQVLRHNVESKNPECQEVRVPHGSMAKVAIESERSLATIETSARN